MISRRSFLSALAAVPFVGKMIPQAPAPFFAPDGCVKIVPPTPDHFGAFAANTKRDDLLNFYIQPAVDRLAYDHECAMCDAFNIPRPTFAEWNQRYQG